MGTCRSLALLLFSCAHLVFVFKCYLCFVFVLGGAGQQTICQAMACEPGMWMVEAVDSAVILQGGGLVVADSDGGEGDNGDERVEEQQLGGEMPIAGKRKPGVVATAEEEGSEGLGNADGDVAEDVEEKVVIGSDRRKPGRVLTLGDSEESKAIGVGRKRRRRGRYRKKGHVEVVQGGGRESIAREGVLEGVNSDKSAAQVDGGRRNRVRKGVPEFSARGAAGDVPQPQAVDVPLIDGLQAKIDGDDNVEEQSGGSEERDEGGIGGSEEREGVTSDTTAESCDSSFPLATTLAAWASLLSVIVTYHMYPPGKDRADASSGLSVGNSGVETV